MASEPFRFKRFQVQDNGATHKVGTDGVLLGSWVSILDTDRRLLDIGTGSGVIALMLAQRTRDEAHVDAIDIELRDVLQARTNAAQSPWAHKVTIHHIPLQDFSAESRYDLIVSNPPFFVNSLQSPEKRRSQARHTLSLSFEDLVTAGIRLLQPKGRLAIILPHREGQDFIRIASDAGLFPARITTFRSRQHKPVERLLVEFSQQQVPIARTEFILYSDGAEWTPEYRTLTRDFYLKT